ncbi:DEK domain-containing chromatin-associated protein 2-like isoform X2 [Primulina huaijiensis]|uniref:DEK domain-containing chromatin-associated protein 2-like isoform X2 n=1 Tax=Primulina huaijiensis TaxID=1492673 RepID=UPI003CC71A2E
MGDKDVESVANGNVEMEEKTEPVMEKTEECNDGVTEMVEENKVAEEVENNDIDKEKVNASKETEEKAKSKHVVKEGGKDERMEETKEEEEKQQVAEENVDMEIEEMNHGPGEKNEADDKVEDKVDGVGEEEKLKESKEERGRKNRLRTKSGDDKNERSVKQETKDKDSYTQREKKTKETKTSTDKKEEQKTPVALTIDRPVRERKSVERLVAIIEQDAAKEFKVEKGRGTALKDIPNVAYKLSRKKSDDTFKLLHTILFGRRGKAAQVKNNISRFSGFAWHDDEEKQTLKLKDKLDKIFKDKLAEFCDVLDIPISATIRKEDIISKLIEFLVAPHATTTELLAEKELSSKGKKRKRENKSASRSITPSEGLAKSQKKTKGTPKKDSVPKPEDESEKDEETHDEDDKSNGEKSEPAEREQKANESDKDKRRKKQGSAKSSGKKGTVEKAKTKNVTISKEDSLPPKKEPPKSPPSRPKNKKDTSTKRSSAKKKDESIKENTSSPKKTSSSVSPGKKILKVKDNLREEKLKPSDNELRNAVCEILKEVDFNTATFTDILKLLVLFPYLVPNQQGLALHNSGNSNSLLCTGESAGSLSWVLILLLYFCSSKDVLNAFARLFDCCRKRNRYLISCFP